MLPLQLACIQGFISVRNTLSTEDFRPAEPVAYCSPPRHQSRSGISLRFNALKRLNCCVGI